MTPEQATRRQPQIIDILPQPVALQALWAACRAAEAGEEEALGALADAAVRTGLPEEEAWRTIESATRKAAVP